MSQVQCRSEITGLSFYESVKDAVLAAEKDKTIWKVSFTSDTGEYIRLTRDGGRWVYDPIILG